MFGALASGPGKGFILGCCVALGACGPDCERPPIFIPALSIEVTDADSGDRICDAIVTLEIEGDSTTLPKSCPYGGGTRVGLYKISVTHDAYEAASLEVSVAADECSEPAMKKVSIQLERVAT
jgi:hypothetical protein